jgi:hypothetical protein
LTCNETLAQRVCSLGFHGEDLYIVVPLPVVQLLHDAVEESSTTDTADNYVRLVTELRSNLLHDSCVAIPYVLVVEWRNENASRIRRQKSVKDILLCFRNRRSMLDDLLDSLSMD